MPGDKRKGMRIIFFLLSFVCWVAVAAQQPVVSYEDLQKKYARFSENDSTAMPAVRKNIRRMRQAGDLLALVYTFEDAVYYSPDRRHKILYADSAVLASLQTGNKALISKAFMGRGIIWHFNYRNYKNALREYLIAEKYAAETGDPYLQHKLNYQLGVIKNYLGHHEEAAHHFKTCHEYFNAAMQKTADPDLRYNYTRGWLNSVHQLAASYRMMGQLDNAEHWLGTAVIDKEVFPQEYGYIQKEKGIIAYRRDKFEQALRSLKTAEGILQQVKEEAALVTVWYYSALAHQALLEDREAALNLQRMDALFSANRMVTADVRASYELLLKNTDFYLNPRDAYYYSGRLMYCDSVLARDMPFLSSKLHREFDVARLHAEREEIRHAKKVGDFFVTAAALLAAGCLCFIGLERRRRHQMTRQYQELQKKLDSLQETLPGVAPASSAGLKPELISPDRLPELLEKLSEFEKGTQYLDPEYSLDRMCQDLQMSKKVLSHLINVERKAGFRVYLGTLRIRYLTGLLNTQPLYLNYTMKALADLCGIGSRQHFSDVFYEVNGIRPSEYIAQRKKNIS